MRIGHGYDVHAFCPGASITLGGVIIPHTKSLQAHSDGDVVIHALCDALLGAAALGDIGQHYPDDAAEYSNIDSRLLLVDVRAKIEREGYQLNNADITIVAQAPKMMPYLNGMKENLASDLNCAISDVNIKATTTEELGAIGREEGIAVHAVVLLTPLS